LDGGEIQDLLETGKSIGPRLKNLLLMRFTIFLIACGFPTWMHKCEKSKTVFTEKENGSSWPSYGCHGVAAPALGMKHHLTCFKAGEKVQKLAEPRSDKTGVMPQLDSGELILSF